MKRTVGFLIASLLLACVGPVAAQDATPVAPGSLLAAMGFPELRIQVDDDGFAMPEQINAGRTLIAYENVGQDSRHSMLLRLPEGVDGDQALADLGAATEEPPAWFLDATYPGFAGETQPGETSLAVVDLTPGPYLVLDDFPGLLDVVESGATPVTTETPAAEGTVGLFEMDFELPESIAPGRQVWEITNTGQAPHELLLAWSSEPVTADQIVDMFMSESEDENATPAGGGPSFAEIEPVGGLGWLSPGGTAWTEVDLQPGTYIAMCFVFDPETGMPHLAMGMVEVFTVGE